MSGLDIRDDSDEPRTEDEQRAQRYLHTFWGRMRYRIRERV